MSGEDFMLGVEEEFQLVDADSGRLRPRADVVIEDARAGPGDVQAELQRWQVETATPRCASLGDVREALTRLRAKLKAAAAARGCRLASTGSAPLATPADARITDKERYRRMAEAFGPVAREQFVCGCHVHVGFADRDLAVAVMNRVRPWLGVLLALSANSPFWEGSDTGYASYRTQVWSRWPTAGPPLPFTSRAEYDAVTASLVRSGTILDLGMIYFDARPSRRWETLEFRVADACLTVDDTVAVAGLARALARTEAEAALAGRPPPAPRHELLRCAQWRAARSGLDGELVDVDRARPVPAATLVARLVEHVRPALLAAGDAEEVEALVAQVLARGNGARRQRAVSQRHGDVRAVVDFVVEQT